MMVDGEAEERLQQEAGEEESPPSTWQLQQLLERLDVGDGDDDDDDDADGAGDRDAGDDENTPLPSAVRQAFARADVETAFESVSAFLEMSVHVKHRVVVVDPSVSSAIELLVDKVDSVGPNEAWGRILGLDVRLVLSFLEATAGLDEGHAFYRDNLLPVLVRRALDLAPERRGAVLDRLCARGYSPQVVRSLLDLHKAAPTASLPGVLEHFPATGQGTRPFVTELLYQAAALDPPGARVKAFAALLPAPVLDASLQARVQLDALLTSARLGGRSVELLVDYYHEGVGDRGDGGGGGSDALVAAVEKAVGVWAGPTATNVLSAYQQKILANFVVRSFGVLTRQDLERRGGLVPKVLKGIGLYLESPLPSVRKVGMCVGNALSAVLDERGREGKAVIFPEDDLADAIRLDDRDDDLETKRDDARDYGWRSRTARLRVVVDRRRDRRDREPDSDDETSSDDASIDSEFGRRDDLKELDQGGHEQNYSVHQIVKMLGGGEENWKEHLEALEVAEELVRASPDELRLYVEPLAKGLMFTRLPAWSQDEDRGGLHEQRRMDSMLALVTELPEAAGSAMVDAFVLDSTDDVMS